VERENGWKEDVEEGVARKPGWFARGLDHLVLGVNVQPATRTVSFVM